MRLDGKTAELFNAPSSRKPLEGWWPLAAGSPVLNPLHSGFLPWKTCSCRISVSVPAPARLWLRSVPAEVPREAPAQHPQLWPGSGPHPSSGVLGWEDPACTPLHHEGLCYSKCLSRDGHLRVWSFDVLGPHQKQEMKAKWSLKALIFQV